MIMVVVLLAIPHKIFQQPQLLFVKDVWMDIIHNLNLIQILIWLLWYVCLVELIVQCVAQLNVKNVLWLKLIKQVISLIQLMPQFVLHVLMIVLNVLIIMLMDVHLVFQDIILLKITLLMITMMLIMNLINNVYLVHKTVWPVLLP